MLARRSFVIIFAVTVAQVLQPFAAAASVVDTFGDAYIFMGILC